MTEERLAAVEAKCDAHAATLYGNGKPGDSLIVRQERTEGKVDTIIRVGTRAAWLIGTLSAGSLFAAVTAAITAAIGVS